MLSLFLPAIFFLATFMIRQGFSTAFVFLGFYYLARKKYILGLAFLIIAIKIHTGILTFMLLPVFFSLIRKWYCRPFPYIIIIPLYLFVAILQDAASSFFGEHKILRAAAAYEAVSGAFPAPEKGGKKA